MPGGGGVRLHTGLGKANFASQMIELVVGFLGCPQPGGGAHPPIPGEGGLGELLWRWGLSSLETAHKNTRFRVVRAAGA